MFLAFNEMKKSKLKYSLIITMITLLSFLTLFLVFLALGLSSSMSNGIKNINSPNFVISQRANNNLLASKITKKDISKINDNEKTIVNFQYMTAVDEQNKDINVALLETSNIEIIPKIIKGKLPQNFNEVVISKTIKKESNIEIESIIELENKKYKVVGFTISSEYQTSPIIYAMLSPTWNTASFVILSFENKNINLPKELVYKSKNQIINSIPGYKQQIATFLLIIIFSILINSMIISVFIYILTIQKSKMFGILKAQGISTFYMIKTTFFQTFNIMIISILMAFSLIVVCNFILPAKVPFMLDLKYLLIIIFTLIFSALLGTSFTFISIYKISALEAINEEN
ncbi:ABC transporter permease family protein [Mycoplasmopsis lipofaciens]|uniref:hypothetical protein n=1 Tax=Mycoplasmopsis lipofaciens TaxID=114884 RepID=UPI000485E9C3|nr:hypothetical protein [Mycoplasmopsis lipofaciens]